MTVHDIIEAMLVISASLAIRSAYHCSPAPPFCCYGGCNHLDRQIGGGDGVFTPNRLLSVRCLSDVPLYLSCLSDVIV